MKEYQVKYEIKTTGYITVCAEDEDEAIEEVDRLLLNEDPKYSDNAWIDRDVLWDCEWDTTTLDAEEV